MFKEKIRMYLTLIKRDNRENYRKIKAYKDTYKGHRCWIIGNGPSLAPEDLDQIKGEFSFAANKIYYIFSKTLWRPSIYMCQDSRVIQSILNDQTPDKYFINESDIFVSKVLKNSAERIFVDPTYYRLCKGKGTKNIHFTNAFPVYVVEGLSVTYSMIQLAVYMGFKEINLLGVDHNQNTVNKDNVDKMHFDSRYKNDLTSYPSDLEYEYLTKCFEKSRIECEKKEIHIYNATRGGNLNVFERKSLEQLLGES